MAIPIFKPISMKSVLAPERYYSIELAVAAQLSLQARNRPVQVHQVLPFLRSYLQDLAQNALTTSSSNILVSSKEACLFLLESIAEDGPGSLDSTLLVDIAISFTPEYSKRVAAILNKALSPISAKDIIKIFHELLSGKYKGNNVIPTFSNILYLDVPDIKAAFSGNPSATNAVKGQLRAKISLLDITHLIITSAIEQEVDIIEVTIRMSESQTSVDSTTFLLDSSLIMDYERLFGLTSQMRASSLWTTQSSTSISSINGLQDLASSLQVDHSLRSAISNLNVVEKPQTTKSIDKGKGRDTSIDDGQKTSKAIAQVLDILPDQDTDFIRLCLSHPTFQGEDGAERLIAALLEGNIPIELSTGTYKPTDLQPTIESDAYSYAQTRTNIFDDQPLDISKLRVGKKTDQADDVIRDKSWLSEMKAEIMRRAQEISDDEEEQSNSRKRVTVQLDEDEFEDFDDDMSAITVMGAPDDTDESEDVETLLELAYLENPKLFERDSATRRSAARANLKKRTGWDDEQLEGWRIMLERNPRKDKILQKHEFSGNKKLPVRAQVEHRDNHDKQDQGPSRGAPRGRGGGRGRGRGDAPGADTERDRAWKDRNKARGGNHNRKRGHDKKMARGGPPLAA